MAPSEPVGLLFDALRGLPGAPADAETFDLTLSVGGGAFETLVRTLADALPADAQQDLLIEFMSSRLESMMEDMESMMSNSVNIKRAQQDIERLIGDVEKLKDKLRETNGSY